MRSETMIAVADVEKSSAWYQRLLGCRSNHGGPHFDRLVNENEEPILLLHGWGADDHHPTMVEKPEGRGGAGIEIYFRTEDLEAALDRARAMDVEWVHEIQHNELAHQDEFRVRDPDGYMIVVCR